MTMPKWMKDIQDMDNIMSKFQLSSEIYKMRIKSRRRDKFANKIADLVVKILNKN